MSTACPVALIVAELNFPAGGAKNVVDPQSVVVVSGIGGLVPTLQMTTSSGETIVSNEIVAPPNPLPTPNTPITLGAQTAFRFSPLKAATTYTLSVPRLTDTCPRQEFAYRSLPSFTTR